MRFKVELSEKAERQLDHILWYLAHKLKNPQAVKAVIDDYDLSIERLEANAEIYDFCKSKCLKDLGFQKLRFESHRYLLVY